MIIYTFYENNIHSCMYFQFIPWKTFVALSAGNFNNFTVTFRPAMQFFSMFLVLKFCSYVFIIKRYLLSLENKLPIVHFSKYSMALVINIKMII